MGEPPGDPETQLSRQEIRRIMVGAMQTLSPLHRQVVELTYYHHCSYQEIAARMDCSVNTVKGWMLQARQRLAPVLAERGLAPACAMTRRVMRRHRTPAFSLLGRVPVAV